MSSFNIYSHGLSKLKGTVWPWRRYAPLWSAILVDGVKALLVALLKINCASVIRGYTKVGTIKYIVSKRQL